MRITSLRASLIALLIAGLSETKVQAQQAQFSPVEVGQMVNGFQDDFNGTVRDPSWVAHGAGGDLYRQDNGVLRVTTSTGDPNHLLYEAPGSNDGAQEVLARIKVNSFGTGDGPRGGISVGISPDSSQGINLMFRDSTNQAIGGVSRHFRLLDDFQAWGDPGLPLAWKENTWYWLRLRQTGSNPTDADNIQAKVWLGDGTVPEPIDWQLTWRRSDRTGFAGIAGSSHGDPVEFEVDYILIKAEGLPSIKVTPSATSVTSEHPLLFAFESSNNFPQSSDSSVHLVFTTTLSSSSIPEATLVIHPKDSAQPAIQPRQRELINKSNEIRLRIDAGAFITDLQYSIDVSGLRDSNNQPIAPITVDIVHAIITPMNVSRSSDGFLVIEFTGALESAKVVQGPYAAVAGSASPHRLVPTNTTEFFRTRLSPAPQAQLQSLRPAVLSSGQGLATSFNGYSWTSPQKPSKFGNTPWAKNRCPPSDGTPKWFFIDRIDQTLPDCDGVAGDITITDSRIAGKTLRRVSGCSPLTDPTTDTVSFPVSAGVTSISLPIDHTDEWYLLCVP